MQIQLKNPGYTKKYIIDSSMPNSSCITKESSISVTWETVRLWRQEREKLKNQRCRFIHVSSLPDLHDRSKELLEINYKHSVLHGYLKMCYP